MAGFKVITEALGVAESKIPMPKASLMKQPGLFFAERAPIDFAERSVNSLVENEALNGKARVDWAGAAIGTGIDMLGDFLTRGQNSDAHLKACQAKLLAATGFTEANLDPEHLPFQSSTGAPEGTGTLNLTILSGGNSPPVGYYSSGSWGSIHVVNGPGAHNGLDDSRTVKWSTSRFTVHNDSGNGVKPLGMALHFARNFMGIGGYSPCQ